jgi:thiol-disulfide isomerase/thioredoxin
MMKIKYFGIALLLIAQTATGIAQTKSGGGYTLTGTVKGLTDGEVELSKYNSKTRTVTKINTAKLKNGKFVMKGKAEGPEIMGLSFQPGNWGTSVFVENSAITIDADTAGAEHYDYTKYGETKGARLKQVKINGSTSQTDYSGYEENNTKGGKKREEVFARQLNYIRPFIAKKPSSVAGVAMLSNHYMFNSSLPLSDLEQMMAQFKKPATQSIYFSNLEKEIAERKAVLPGNFAEDFTLLQRDSTKFTLSSTRGKYVMIDFWASWCKPCREAIPHWKEVYAKYKGKGFEIVSVTNDSRWNDWIKAMDVEQMTWIQTIDEFPVKMMPARVLSKYKHGTIPLYVLLDKEGKILVKTGDESEIDRKLAEVLNN